MSLEKFVKNKIVSNKLDIDLSISIDTILKMKESGHPYNNEEELFYYYILNLFGKILLTMDNGDVTRTELLGLLKVKFSEYNNKKMYFYRYETEEDYYYWLNIRKNIYNKLTDKKEIRLLNFIEMSTFDFVCDGTNNDEYIIYNETGKINHIQKTGMICASDGSKFMKTLATNFNLGNYYKVI